MIFGELFGELFSEPASSLLCPHFLISDVQNNTENGINREEITDHVLILDFMETAHETPLGILTGISRTPGAFHL
jgi:hypothetical protein